MVAMLVLLPLRAAWAGVHHDQMFGDAMSLAESESLVVGFKYTARPPLLTRWHAGVSYTYNDKIGKRNTILNLEYGYIQ